MEEPVVRQLISEHFTAAEIFTEVAVVEWPPPDATLGPLTDDDPARLRRDDIEGTSIGSLDAGGCSPEQDAADRRKTGPCGNVMQVVLAPGNYAVLGGPAEADLAAGRRPPLAVLEVLP